MGAWHSVVRGWSVFASGDWFFRSRFFSHKQMARMHAAFRKPGPDKRRHQWETTRVLNFFGWGGTTKKCVNCLLEAEVDNYDPDSRLDVVLGPYCYASSKDLEPPFVQVANEVMPVWLKASGTPFTCQHASKGCAIVEINTTLNDADLLQQLTKPEVSFLSTSGRLVTVPHGVSYLQDLILLLGFHASYGPINRYLTIEGYDWLWPSWYDLYQALLEANKTPIPQFVCDTYGFNATHLSYISYGEIYQIFLHLLVIFGSHGDPKLFKVPKSPDDLINFSCCTGLSFENLLLPEFLRKNISLNERTCLLLPPSAYTSTSSMILYERRGGFMLGWTTNIWSPLALGCAWQGHGVTPSEPLPVNALIPNPATLRWPEHFTSWAACHSVTQSGHISASIRSAINGVYLLAGASLDKYPLTNPPAASRSFSFSEVCCHGHVMGGYPYCQLCQWLSSRPGVILNREDPLDYTRPFTYQELMVALLDRSSSSRWKDLRRFFWSQISM